MRGQLAVRQFNIDKKSGPQKRAGRNTGTRRVVAPRGKRGNGRRQRRQPLQNTNGSEGDDRYIKRGAAKRAAATGRGRRRCRRPLQKASGRHRRPLQEAAVTGSGRYRRPLQGAGGGRRPRRRPLHKHQLRTLFVSKSCVYSTVRHVNMQYTHVGCEYERSRSLARPPASVNSSALML